MYFAKMEDQALSLKGNTGILAFLSGQLFFSTLMSESLLKLIHLATIYIKLATIKVQGNKQINLCISLVYERLIQML